MSEPQGRLKLGLVTRWRTRFQKPGVQIREPPFIQSKVEHSHLEEDSVGQPIRSGSEFETPTWGKVNETSRHRLRILNTQNLDLGQPRGDSPGVGQGGSNHPS